mgnify:CR=1 FL=1
MAHLKKNSWANPTTRPKYAQLAQDAGAFSSLRSHTLGVGDRDEARALLGSRVHEHADELLHAMRGRMDPWLLEAYAAQLEGLRGVTGTALANCANGCCPCCIARMSCNIATMPSPVVLKSKSMR